MRALVRLGAAQPGARQPETFEDWVTARFGRRLYDAFFRSYTEKVWGIPGTEIRVAVGGAADQGLLALAGVPRPSSACSRKSTTTLIEEFQYPRLGPGQMWERFAGRLEEDLGIPVRMRQRCVGDQARRRSRRDRHDRSTDGHVTEYDGGRRALDARPQDLIRALDPRAACGRARGRREAALPRLLPRRADDRRGGAVPGQLDLPPRPRRSAPAGCRTSAPGAPRWSCPGRRASASSTSASRATTSGRCPTRRPSSSPPRRWRASA